MGKQKNTPRQAQQPAQQEKLNRLLLIIAVALTAIIYFPSLHNELTNWDDQEYITDNAHIKSLGKENIAYHFTHFHMGNYHPLTMISLSMDYKDPLDPQRFHTTNFILHLLNVLLVFLFVYLLTQKNAIAFVAALLFGLHPMHVESVAWASERKDVLYAFFFLAAMCTYLRYVNIEKGKPKWYLLTTLLFVLSLLSKGQAVVLPLIFVLIDYFNKKKFEWKMLADKIPWLGLSLIFGIIAIKAQQSLHALQDTSVYSPGDRIIFGAYGITAYLVKLVAPFNLSCFYPFPVKEASSYPLIFYSGLLVVPLLFYILFFFRKNSYVIFAFAFFLISVSIVLQLLPVGAAIIADRYTYIPYLGFFILAGKLVSDAMEKQTQMNRSGTVVMLQKAGMVIIVLCIMVFSWLTFSRIQVWKDSLTLWNDAISKDQTSPKVFQNRGKIYEDKQQFDLAIADFNKAIELKNDFADAYYNRGLAYYFTKNYDAAIRDYSSAVKYDPQLAVAWHNRAGTYFTLKKFKEALSDALKAQELGYPVDPKFIEAIKMAGGIK